MIIVKIELHEIFIKDIVRGYKDSSEEGVVGYDGLLNIRPQYQREFVYDDIKRNAVIDTIVKGFPLNVMYWVKNSDGTFEVLDGQQRTISFCQYVSGDFSVNNRYFNNLTNVEKEQILNYKVMVYYCEGNDKEKLDWFKTINIAGEKLTDQELRNAVYTGPWLSHAKLYFSKSNCAAYLLAKNYVNGSPIRQELLQTAISWKNKGDIEEYMAKHQHAPDANELWYYFRDVIEWIQLVFKKYRREMKGINWGLLYDLYHNNQYDADDIEKEVANLMADDEVQNKKGIYTYIFDKNEKYLNLRAFTDSEKRTMFERQHGVCPICGKTFIIEQMEGDHITPWVEGGKTTIDNGQMLCRSCNRHKSSH